MKNLLHSAVTCMLFCMPASIFSQTAPVLGPAADFVLFSSVGAVTNVGISQVTGNVGSNSAGATGFGNVNGQMHAADALTIAAASALGLAYIDASTQGPDSAIAPQLGNGQVLLPGIYSIAGAANLADKLTLDGGGDPNAVFIIQLNGVDFSTTAGSSVELTNGTLACNVFFVLAGAADIVTGTAFRGNILSAAAITFGTGASLEGRALTTVGAVGISGVLASTPIGCGSPLLTGPAPANLGSTACYSLLTTTGAMTNAGTSSIDGDVGTNTGALSGFAPPTTVGGMIHPIPDDNTQAASDDLGTLYNYLNGLTCDIELLYPAQFGNSQVLTPHVYCMNGAASLTDTIFLDGMGNPDAVFVIQVNGGALGTSTFANVTLINGTQPKNVFFKVEGAISSGTNSNFVGTFVANNDAIFLATNTSLDGRAFSTTGAVTVNDVNITTDLSACGSLLPLDILSFDGNISGAKASLAFTTTGKPTANYYAVEKNTGENKWEVIYMVKAASTGNATTKYSATDMALNLGSNTYRLKQIDKDGKVRIYKNITLKNTSVLPMLSVIAYPNPVANMLNIMVTVNKPVVMQVEIFDIAGRIVLSQKRQAQTGNNNITKDMDRMPAGTYMLKITTPESIITKQIIKQ